MMTTREHAALGNSARAHLTKRDAVSRAVFPAIDEDFVSSNASVLDKILGAAVSSGTIAAVNGTANHPGVVALRDSTTANGGYRIMTDVNALVLGGGEKAVFVFQDRNTGARATASFRMGFQDSTAIQTQPTDGVWLNVAGGIIKGQCKNNAGPTDTASTFTLTANTWYTGIIEVGAGATAATFTLLSEAGAVLWQATVSANVPNAAGRETGFGVIAGETSTDAAADIMWLDYIGLEINRVFVR